MHDFQYNLFLLLIIGCILGFIVYGWLGTLLGLIITTLLHISNQLRTIIKYMDKDH